MDAALEMQDLAALLGRTWPPEPSPGVGSVLLVTLTNANWESRIIGGYQAFYHSTHDLLVYAAEAGLCESARRKIAMLNDNIGGLIRLWCDTPDVEPEESFLTRAARVYHGARLQVYAGSVKASAQQSHTCASVVSLGNQARLAS